MAGESPVHRCDARVKIIALFAFSIAVFFVRTWWGMAAFAAVAVVSAAVAHIPARRMLVPLVPVIILAACAVVFAVVGSPTQEGLINGLFLAVRMIVLVAASFIVCFTTTSTALLAAFERLISPLRALRVPVDDIALTLSLALRFIPVIADEFTSVRKAQIARGATLAGMSFRRRLQIWGAAFSAVFIGLFRRADALASALDARCYGAERANGGKRYGD
ncbi:MAG: energy-coupling factor transporter transmembrane protein EcfT [Eggerthellaceae bacterium]|nr:energy-coupling factor transporter transmembrane protein EcfT [Eggerthellaceae bacterium]